MIALPIYVAAAVLLVWLPVAAVGWVIDRVLTWWENMGFGDEH